MGLFSREGGVWGGSGGGVVGVVGVVRCEQGVWSVATVFTKIPPKQFENIRKSVEMHEDM